ncbi:MAG: dienelactone hydrolase family protein [Bacteroidia bacterium]|nr:dienelactone hydrolase family protein [Bacteroidia bacterium]
MKKINKKNLDPKVFKLYDDYAHNRIDRRSFIDKLSFFAIGGLTVPTLLEYLMPDYKNKIQVQNDDPRLNSEMITYDSPNGGGKINGLLSRPVGATEKIPGIIVVHENRGLNPHIKDVGRRAALEGFISLAPDALTPLGGYPGNDDDGRTLQRQRDKNEMLEDFIAAYNFLKDHPECNGRIGIVGFCFGGWISNMMAVRIPDLGAAVPFYGGQPDSAEVEKINAPLLLQFAENDERVNKGWPDYEERLKELNKEYAAYIYPGVNHGFHNDTTPRYDEASAKLAWQRTIDFFRDKLN